jgi:hypothetical protein
VSSAGNGICIASAGRGLSSKSEQVARLMIEMRRIFGWFMALKFGFSRFEIN